MISIDFLKSEQWHQAKVYLWFEKEWYGDLSLCVFLIDEKKYYRLMETCQKYGNDIERFCNILIQEK